MSAAFLHLSDIHFGQEKNGVVRIHDDVKEQLILDVRAAVAQLPSQKLQGIIVTGDVAFSGKAHQYTSAAAWLDLVANAGNCDITEVLVVPGNHDIDRDEITAGAEIILDTIAEQGEDALDRFLASEADRELLFRRFQAFQPFAAGYRCPIDQSGNGHDEHTVELAAGKSIRFARLNSALICSRTDTEGKLILGARQRVLRQLKGEELVVLSHHPIHWFRDSEDTRRFVRSRARVFISGHEHAAAANLERVEAGRDILLIAAGATIPPADEGLYGYCYNILQFSCVDDRLVVDVDHRLWNDEMKRFERSASLSHRFELDCPNFAADFRAQSGAAKVPCALEVEAEGPAARPESKESTMDVNHALLNLHFFRDLTPMQRLTLLAELEAIPRDWNGVLTEPSERAFFDKLVSAGLADTMWRKISELLDNERGLIHGRR
jgi:hypothetical protein